MTALQMEKELLARWHALPREKQQTALDFVQFLDAEAAPVVRPLESALGLCADLDLSLKAEAIDEMKREAPRRFPRENF